VHTGDARQRAELTTLLGLTRTGTGTVLHQLQELRLTRSAAPPPAGREGAPTGRPSHHVELHPESPAVVAAQLTVHSLRIAELRLGGVLGGIEECPLPEPASPDAVLTLAADRIASYVATMNRCCLAVGLALPSAVGHDQTALAAFNLPWPAAVPVRVKLQAMLDDRACPLDVHAGNDANLAALAEYRHGAGRQASDLLYLTTGRGVGGALVSHGQLFTGSAGYALEVGHLTVEPNGRRCFCGNRGCLGAESDAAALLLAAGRRPTRQPDAAARKVIASATGDPVARAAVDAVAVRLGIGLASLVNVLNPDRVVLGGVLADLYAAGERLVRKTLTQRSFLDQAAHVDVRAAALDEAILIGAGELAFQPLLDDPRAVIAALPTSESDDLAASLTER
jgi:predicted NBD/HSP70 family sugar kinase